MLVGGQWTNAWYDTKSTKGRFVREPTQFRDSISPVPSSKFPAEPGRYHLYVSLACPWAHRTLIVRKLKGLEETISVSVVNSLMSENGWSFHSEDGGIPDTVNGCEFLYEIYLKAQADYTGRVTVPVLWDKQRHTIVNNESAEIIRILNTAFNETAGSKIDFYPETLREQIDSINDDVYEYVNNGVYRAGFATTQEAYEEGVRSLFETLDKLEATLEEQNYLCGDRLTEADIRLFTTLFRFDPVYYSHFKCNLRRISDYPNLYDYLKAIYQVPGVKETCNLQHIKSHYYRSHLSINPTGIVPLGPEINLEEPHRRPAPKLEGST